MNAPITLIAAIGKHRELGKGGDLLWRISDDLKRFKELTTGSPIIMGRKTYESIGKPLPNRTNIIVTRDQEYQTEGCVVVNSVTAAIEAAQNTQAEKIFVIGGSEIYAAALPYADTLNLTLIDAEDPDADVFFPEFENEFKETSRGELREHESVQYQWVTFKRK